MTKKFSLAAIFALLTVSTPASAATIQWDLANVMIGNGAYTITGFFDYNTNNGTVTNWDIVDTESVPPPLSAFFTPQHGSATNNSGTITFTSDFLIASGGGPYCCDRQISLQPLDSLDGSITQVPLGSGSSLSGGPAEFFIPIESGGSLLETPLPAALPLFGSTVLALGAFAWQRRRRGIA